MAKGIRVNQLAKELGVESKSILAKCREEGLGDKVPNHMSVLSIGLAETVREWFSGSGGGTAVEIAPPVEAKPKRSRTRKAVEGAEEPSESHTDAVPEPEVHPEAEAQPPVAPVTVAQDRPVSEPAEVVAESAPVSEGEQAAPPAVQGLSDGGETAPVEPHVAPAPIVEISQPAPAAPHVWIRCCARSGR